VCNIAARSPLRVLADVRRALRNPRAIFAAAAAAVIGLLFLGAGALLLMPAMPDPPRDFGAIELLTLLVGLALDALVGEDVRRLAGSSS
jgi:hypothetical protein